MRRRPTCKPRSNITCGSLLTFRSLCLQNAAPWPFLARSNRQHILGCTPLTGDRCLEEELKTLSVWSVILVQVIQHESIFLLCSTGTNRNFFNCSKWDWCISLTQKKNVTNVKTWHWEQERKENKKSSEYNRVLEGFYSRLSTMVLSQMYCVYTINIGRWCYEKRVFQYWSFFFSVFIKLFPNSV